MILLRDYQDALLESARAKMRAGFRRVLIVAPTGAGKTVLAAAMIGNAARSGLVCWFVVHRRVLVKQTSNAFDAFGIAHGVVQAGSPFDPAAKVQIASVASLAGVLDRLPAPDIIVTDEAHHAASSTWARVLLHAPDAWSIGLTATPERLDGRGLAPYYDTIAEGPSTRDLIRQGWLSPYRYFAPEVVDLSGVRRTSGDFNTDDLTELLMQPAIVGDAVKHYRELADGMQSIGFAVSVKHSEAMAAAFRAAGIGSFHIDSKMPSRERERRFAAFESGDAKVLWNVDLVSEGYDVPNVSCVIMQRPSESLTMIRQQAGRALRLADGKTHAVLIDQVANWLRHGLPDDPVMWSLKGSKEREALDRAAMVASVHQCLYCYVVSPSRSEVCRGCGATIAGEGRSINAREGELFELDPATARQMRAIDKARATEERKAEERACKTMAELTELAKARGYQNPAGWAYNTYKRRSAWRKGGRAA